MPTPTREKITSALRDAFWAALADDLSTSRALAAVSGVARDEALTAADRWSLYADFDRVLGFGLAEASDPDVVEAVEVDHDLAALLARRQQARNDRDWVTADRLRDDLAERGYDVVDGPDGATLRPRNP